MSDDKAPEGQPQEASGSIGGVTRGDPGKARDAAELLPNQGVCMFCGGTGLTKQHILPNWLKHLFPKHLPNEREYGGIKYGSDAGVRPARVERRQGHLLSQKSRSVCEKCNGGWMKAIEDEVIPYITGMYHGRELSLDEGATLALSTWAAMTLVMVETHDPYTASTTADQSKWMQERRLPPPVSCVWLGRSAVKAEVGSDHLSARLRAMKTLPPEVTDYSQPFTTKIGTLWIGDLLLHVFSSTLPDLDDFDAPPSWASGLVKIYPSPQAVEWPLPLTRSVEDTWKMRNLLAVFDPE